MRDDFRSHRLLIGTLILTASGIFSRVLGFFYRIFLSRRIGAEGLGIYQMIFPVYGICFSLCAGSLQTAISRFTAADRAHAGRTLLSGLFLSLSLSLAFAGLILHFSQPIAVYILREPRCAPLLSIMALAFPCISVNACISGYYYGKELVAIPAVSQLVEQCIRIFAVWFTACILISRERPVTVQLAVIGLAAGEAASALFTALSYFILHGIPTVGRVRELYPVMISLTSMALPLMATRLIMNLLQSAETILIPGRLSLFGLTHTQSVSIYGVLTGMAMPFILFPSAIVNSLAVVLLPNIARQQSCGNQPAISRRVSMSLRYSLYMGILCVGIFAVFGETLGLQVFKNRDAGTFISILSWLCPFLYLATTMGSILNGLGKTNTTFLHHIAAMLLRLAFVFFGIPRFGIRAFLWGMLAGELLLALLHYISLLRLVSFSRNVWENLIKPIACILAALGIFRLLPGFSTPFGGMAALFITLLKITFVCSCYLLFLLLLHKESS